MASTRAPRRRPKNALHERPTRCHRDSTHEKLSAQLRVSSRGPQEPRPSRHWCGEPVYERGPGMRGIVIGDTRTGVIPLRRWPLIASLFPEAYRRVKEPPMTRSRRRTTPKTGVYWIPLDEIREARGFTVLLVNARHVKNVPGRKSDVRWCRAPRRPSRRGPWPVRSGLPS